MCDNSNRQVSHFVKRIGDELPELTCGPLAWSLRDKTRVFRYATTIDESSTVPVRREENVSRVSDNIEELLGKVNVGLETDQDIMDVEATTTRFCCSQRVQTRAQKIFISVVNYTCGSLYVEYAASLPQSDFAIESVKRLPDMRDMQVLLHPGLQWQQGEFSEFVEEVYIPMFEPFGGSLCDFADATFEEQQARRVFGTVGPTYTEWAEFETGATLFIFSCRSQSGWYTYLYTGVAVRCIGRAKFRGMVFERDEVIYSLDDVEQFKLFDHDRPVVNFHWRKYPFVLDGTVHRVVCRDMERGHVVLYAASGVRNKWPSKCTIEDVMAKYNEGKLAPLEMTNIRDGIDLHNEMVNLKGRLNELVVKQSGSSVLIIPDTITPCLRPCTIMTECEKLTYFDYCAREGAVGIEYEGMFCVKARDVERRVARVRFCEIQNRVRACVLIGGSVRALHNPFDFKNALILSFMKFGGNYTTGELPWYYRVRWTGPNVVNRRGGLTFSLEDCQSVGFVRVRNVNTHFTAFVINLRSNDVYIPSWLSFMH